MRFYTHTHISEHIAETPEGYLVCLAVPIARTGEQTYAPGELPSLEPGEDGLIHVERHEVDVFDPTSMGSYEGKPNTVDHPRENVTPVNWRELAVGHAQNIRRGEGEASDLLLADLLITEQKAITLIRGGLREVSCGYDAEYEQIAPGRGRQRNIRGNHIALVRRGRCGSRCRINDNREDDMAKKKSTVLDSLTNLLKKPEVARLLDEEPQDKPDEQAEDTPPATDEDKLATLENRVNELEILVRGLTETTDEEAEEQPAQPDVPDKSQKSNDAAPARTADAETVARARIVSPNLVVQVGDNDCAVKRAALRQVKDADAKTARDAALSGTTLDSCDCVTLDAAFLAAAEVARVKRNAATADGLNQASTRDFGHSVTPAEINAANAKFHKREV